VEVEKAKVHIFCQGLNYDTPHIYAFGPCDGTCVSDIPEDMFSEIYRTFTQDSRGFITDKASAPVFARRQAGKLLDHLASEDGLLTVQTLSLWRPLIMHAIGNMRFYCENWNFANTEDSKTEYYASSWTEIDAANCDDLELIEALNKLRHLLYTG
jgi:hypothetical protein